MSTDSGVTVEMKFDDWTDVTEYVRFESGISISRGRSSQGGEVNPSSASFTLDNRDGRFSTHNPTSPYYGYIGRNTPVRISKTYGGVSMRTNGQSGDRFECAAPGSTSTDMDIRVDAEPETWRQQQTLAAQGYNFGSSQMKWVFYVDAGGFLHLAVGTAFLTQDISSTAVVPNTGRVAVRVALDGDNGASGNTVTFYTASTLGGSWTQLGSAVTTAGTVTGLDNAKPLSIAGTQPSISGRIPSPLYPGLCGKVYGAKVYSDLGTTVFASPDFTAQSEGATSFSDAQSNTWTAYGDAQCSGRVYRFTGEVSSWPRTADSTGTDVTSSVECFGILRRSQQGIAPLHSPMYNYYTSGLIATNASVGAGYYGYYRPYAYWPMEDRSGSTTLAAATSGVAPATINSGVLPGDYTGFACSDAIAHVNTGGRIRFIPPSTTAGSWTAEFLMSAPGGITNGVPILNVWGQKKVLQLSYPTTDHLQMDIIDTSSNTPVTQYTSGSLAASVVGKLLWVQLQGKASGVTLNIRQVTDSTWTTVGTVTASGGDADTMITSLTIAPETSLNDVYFGHMALFNADLASLAGGIAYGGLSNLTAFPNSLPPVNAYWTEAAPNRYRRLITEAGYTPYVVGGGLGSGYSYLSSTNMYYPNTPSQLGTSMGYQTLDTFISNAREVENTDLGMIFEPRHFVGLGYISRSALYSQSPKVTFSYSNGELSGIIQGEEDDLGVENDVTVQRASGSSGRYEDTTSSMSTQDPPNGIGRYASSYNLSLATDDQCVQQASWRVHTGTVNELRYNSLSFALENVRVAASSTLTTGLLDLDVGDRIAITDTASWLPPYDISQLVIGYREYIDGKVHQFTFFTIPESPYRIAQAAAAGTSVTQAKCDSELSTLSSSATSGATTFSVASTGSLWTTSGVDFDIDVGGERMTCTSVSGSSSPQTFTVTRSVNGVVKAQTANTTVKLWQPSTVAL